MTQTSFPFEDEDTTETQFSRWARNIGEGVVPDANGDALTVTVGTGLAVDVDPGQCLVRGHYYTSTAVESLSLATADASDPRLDTVVLRLDPTANSVVLAVVVGSPAAVPTEPGLTQTDAGVYELPLANVLVPANSGVPTTVTDRRVFARRLGELSDVSLSSPVAGEKLVYDGTEWVNLEAYAFVDTVYFTSNGTFSKGNYPWLRAIRVKVQGGGGGGGGVDAAGAAGGGGGGGYAESFVTDIAGLSSSVTVTVGAGGAGGSGAVSGSGGSDSSFGALTVGNGGGGGGTLGNPGSGDSGSGDVVFNGDGGGPGGNSDAPSGKGGGSHLGGGAIGGRNQVSSNGANGEPYGGGGGGGRRTSSGSVTGGDGAPGIVIVELYA